MNYTQVVNVLDENSVEHYISPRYQMCPIGDMMQVMNSEGIEIAQNGTMCIKFMDTEQEKAIDLGVGWPYSAMEPYECMIATEFQKKAIKVGEKVKIKVVMGCYWQLMRN